MPRNRIKPGSRSFAGTGEKPISIQTENKLEKAIAANTLEQARVTILKDENARLQMQLDQKQEDMEAEALQAKLEAEAIVREGDRLLTEQEDKLQLAKNAAGKAESQAQKKVKKLQDELKELRDSSNDQD